MGQKFTALEKANEARRELAMRRRVYGAAMSATQRRQVALMEEIVDDYQAQVRPEERPRNLFGERDD